MLVMEEDLISENKYVSKVTSEEGVLEILRYYCLKDEEHGFGNIASLYYDTPYLHSYCEKADGDYQKQKVRLRWYLEDKKNEDARGFVSAFLEIKMKEGSGRRKYREKLVVPNFVLEKPRDYLEYLSRLVVIQHNDEILEPFSGFLMPLVIIKYLRWRFVCPISGSRVCLDTSISGDWVAPGFIPHKINETFLESSVIELKGGSKYEPHWLKDIYRIGFRKQGFSKFGTCVSQLIKGEHRK